MNVMVGNWKKLYVCVKAALNGRCACSKFVVLNCLLNEKGIFVEYGT